MIRPLAIPIMVILCAFTINDPHPRVVDGDTLEVAGQRVRLWGIDAPERSQTCTVRWWIKYPCGERAAAELRRLIGDDPLTCTVKTTDRFARLVATCSTPKTPDLGAALVRSGWALDFARYSKGAYAPAESEALEARRGFWAGRFSRPEDWRRGER